MPDEEYIQHYLNSKLIESFSTDLHNKNNQIQNQNLNQMSSQMDGLNLTNSCTTCNCKTSQIKKDTNNKMNLTEKIFYPVLNLSTDQDDDMNDVQIELNSQEGKQ